MKGIICYYSATGNTKLALEYIAGSIKNVEFDFFNIAKEGLPDFSPYQIAGFGTFTDFGSPPQLFCRFMEKISPVDKLPAFVFGTYGMIPIKILKDMKKLAVSKGFQVINGHILHTPENYPPLVSQGTTSEEFPTSKDMEQFNSFISLLDNQAAAIARGEEVKKVKLSSGLLGFLIPRFSRKHAKKDMGKQMVDESLCTKCGICKKNCPYEAVNLQPFPYFDHAECYGCWACFNRCPRKAISTEKIQSGRYPGPLQVLKDKLLGS